MWDSDRTDRRRCDRVVRLCRFGCAAVLSALAATAHGVEFDADDAIQPSVAHPRYWHYQGEAVVLLGGSREDNLFQIADLDAHLDVLASSGGNYIRNTLSSRDDGNLWPFARGADGKYDLERPNPAYYDRLNECLRLAYERDIVVQIELWDRFDYARDVWERNPFRPSNNVNYSVESSGLKNHYPKHPGSNENRFFFSVPELDNNAVVLPYQQAHVDRVLAVTLQYPNVLYCMDNETSGAEAWGAYWAGYIKSRAKEAGVRVCVTEMWDDWKLHSPTHRRTLDHPERYDFADISQNNHQKGQTHWNNLQWAREYVASAPRPLNNVKIYGADGGPFGNSRDAVERFWRGLVGGAASVRFHRPDAGIGLSGEAQAHLKSARMLCDVFDFFRATPDAESERLGERGENEAYASFIGDEACVVYFPDGGSVRVQFQNGPVRVQWLDAARSAIGEDVIIDESNPLYLTAPGGGHWMAIVRR